MNLLKSVIFLSRKNLNTAGFKFTAAIKWLLLPIAFIFLHFAAVAQCPASISNNDFQIRPATCAGTVATLKGTVPTGGTGSYTYQWQKSTGNCGIGNFVDIPNATAIDYGVPAGTDDDDCFRRVVRSGTCALDYSDREKVPGSARSTPAAPTTTAVASTCLVSTGTITVTSPTGTGITYSIDGTTYTNTSGIFPGVAPGTYTVTAKFPAGCISPPKTQVVNSALSSGGSISPASATFCAGDSQVLTVSGGSSYRWYRDNQLIANATGNTYTAKIAGVYTADIINGVCTVKSANSVTVTVNPAPTGTISPAPATICAGGSVTLTATGGTSYQWYRNNFQIAGATSATYPAPQAGSYSVDIINSFGCKAKASNTSEVTVTTSPTGTISPSSGSLCSASSVLLSVSGGSSYQWYRDGQAISNATGPTYSATSAGVYTVDIISGSCSGKASNSAVITGGAVTASISPTSATICPGNSQVLTATGNGTYQWYRNNVAIPGATSATYPANQSGAYTVLITNGSCSTQSNIALVTLGVSPSGTISPSSAFICPGNNVTLTATPAGGGSTVQWFRNGTLIPNAVSLTYPASQTGNYSVQFSNGTCSSAALNVVTVAEAPAINFAFTPTQPTCTSPAGSITVNGVSGGSTASYLYSKDNGANFQSSSTFTNLTAGTYQIVVKDTAGCVSSPKPVVIQQNGTVPNLVITNPPRLCPGATANLQAPAVTAGSDTGLTYSYWRDTLATTPLLNPATVAAGRYYIKAVNRFGCSAVKVVNVIPHTVTPGTINPVAPPVACVNTPVVLTASTGTAFQWYRNDTLIAGATQVTHAATRAGRYSVVINNGTCNVAASNKVDVTFQPCIPDAKVLVPTAFTPNRNNTNDLLRPLLYNIAELKYFRVYNRWGQEVFQTKEPGKGWDGTVKGVPQPTDTFSWVVECVGKNGETIKQAGRSLLIR
ncbi:MAG TPA: gliding motility-associated C-terminal domain-containing protein [Flavisolibacter sp.]|nr:gliding motility-associated C-terminal domain-containing protein [Flavisolibacter sp.]